MDTHTRITLDEYTTTLIRLKARQLSSRYGFNKSDREDIQQELTLALLTRLDDFDPRRGRPATFVRMVVNRRAASLIRQRRTCSRDFRRNVHALDELRDDQSGNLAEPAVDERRQRDLEIDLSEALLGLPHDLRSIAEDLRDATLAAVARQRGCSRETMRCRARKIRSRLAHCGLDAYIANPQNGAAPRK